MLTRAGWRPTVAGQWPLINRDISHHLRLVNPGGFPPVLELHRRWMTLPASLRDTAAEELVWQSAQPAVIGSARARILAPIDHFIYLAAHLARHAAHQDRLIWYADLEALVDCHGAGFDWDALVARAIQLRLVVPLAWVLDALAQRRLAADAAGAGLADVDGVAGMARPSPPAAGTLPAPAQCAGPPPSPGAQAPVAPALSPTLAWLRGQTGAAGTCPHANSRTSAGGTQIFFDLN